VNLQNLSGFWTLLFITALFLVVARYLHHQLQGLLFVLFSDRKKALFLYAFLFFPGVLIHEGSHFLAAKISGVPTGKFSLVPEILPGNKFRFGYVQTAKKDFFRNFFIGTAPLIFGCLCLWGVGSYLFAGTGFLTEKPYLGELYPMFLMLFSSPINMLLGYLLFVISSMMFPSVADRKTWLPVGIISGVFLVVLLLTGNIEIFNFIFRILGDLFNRLIWIFGLSLFLHLLGLFPVGLLRLISKILAK
jgi:hypothetical protein